MFFFSFEICFIAVNTKPERVERQGVTSRQSEESSSREQDRNCYLAVQLRPPYAHIGPWRPWATAKELWLCSLNACRIHSLSRTQSPACACWFFTCVNTQVQVKVQLPVEVAPSHRCAPVQSPRRVKTHTHKASPQINARSKETRRHSTKRLSLIVKHKVGFNKRHKSRNKRLFCSVIVYEFINHFQSDENVYVKLTKPFIHHVASILTLLSLFFSKPRKQYLTSHDKPNIYIY